MFSPYIYIYVYYLDRLCIVKMINFRLAQYIMGL